MLLFACGVYVLLRPVMPWHGRSVRWSPGRGLGLVAIGLAFGAHVTALYMYGTPFVLRLSVSAAVPVLGILGSLLLLNVVSDVKRLLGPLSALGVEQ